MRAGERAHFMPADDEPHQTQRVTAPVPSAAADVLAQIVEPATLRLAFAPLHKVAFGSAVGVAAAVVMLVLTVYQLTLAPDWAPDLHLLANYFQGYRVSWPGAIVGMLWGFGVGFIAGWFFAFCRNLAIATSVFISRTKAELGETRDFLDHI
jgi:hypothetical protein